MTFDEWFKQYTIGERRPLESEYMTSDMRQCWQAAQREAARRCAEICRDAKETAFPFNAVNAIEREFGLDQ